VTTHRWILAIGVVLAVTLLWLRGAFVGVGSSGPAPVVTPAAQEPAPAGAITASLPGGLARATFASGCFWCTEADFDKVPGVVSTISGYTGGAAANPSYEAVSSGRTGQTGHAEAVQVTYDPKVVSYDELLDHYWRNVDPFTAHRQFCDVGNQYRPEIFVHDSAQRAAAEASKSRVQQRFRDQAVVVAITNAAVFYPAEDYHQDYYKKNSAQYRFYRYGCGRDARLEAIWGENHG
jgi:peptide-methionine (S)-S-oxide reductase